MTLGGDLASFNATDYQMNLATVLRVESEDISVSARAGSVVVQTEIRESSPDEALSITSSLRVALSDETAAASALGLQHPIQAVTTPTTVVYVFPSPSLPPSIPPSPPPPSPPPALPPAKPYIESALVGSSQSLTQAHVITISSLASCFATALLILWTVGCSRLLRHCYRKHCPSRVQVHPTKEVPTIAAFEAQELDPKPTDDVVENQQDATARLPEALRDVLALVRLVVQSGSDREQIDALDALVATLDGDGAADLCEALRSSATVETLCALLASGEASHEVSARILLVLGNLSSEEVDPFGASETKRRMQTCGGFEAVVQHLFSPSEECVFYAAGACMNVCSSVREAEVIKRRGALPRLVDLANHSADEALAGFARGCLENLQVALTRREQMVSRVLFQTTTPADDPRRSHQWQAAITHEMVSRMYTVEIETSAASADPTRTFHEPSTNLPRMYTVEIETSAPRHQARLPCMGAQCMHPAPSIHRCAPRHRARLPRAATAREDADTAPPAPPAAPARIGHRRSGWFDAESAP